MPYRCSRGAGCPNKLEKNKNKKLFTKLNCLHQDINDVGDSV